jgi:hypothetical protein
MAAYRHALRSPPERSLCTAPSCAASAGRRCHGVPSGERYAVLVSRFSVERRPAAADHLGGDGLPTKGVVRCRELEAALAVCPAKFEEAADEGVEACAPPRRAFPISTSTHRAATAFSA